MDLAAPIEAVFINCFDYAHESLYNIRRLRASV